MTMATSNKTYPLQKFTATETYHDRNSNIWECVPDAWELMLQKLITTETYCYRNLCYLPHPSVALPRPISDLEDSGHWFSTSDSEALRQAQRRRDDVVNSSNAFTRCTRYFPWSSAPHKSQPVTRPQGAGEAGASSRASGFQRNITTWSFSQKRKKYNAAA